MFLKLGRCFKNLRWCTKRAVPLENAGKHNGFWFFWRSILAKYTGKKTVQVKGRR